MTLYGNGNESLRLEIAGHYNLRAKRTGSVNRLLMFLEIKKFGCWWVTFDNTITVPELKKLAQWFSYLGSHTTDVGYRIRLGKKALLFDYFPIKSKRGMLFIKFSRRLSPGRKRA